MDTAFDFENEAVLLAEKASSWRGDWVDFAELAEKRLRAAHIAGLKEAVEILKRNGLFCDAVTARISQLEKDHG